jgi:peptidoglycan-associated lipoprotein
LPCGLEGAFNAGGYWTTKREDHVRRTIIATLAAASSVLLTAACSTTPEETRTGAEAQPVERQSTASVDLTKGKKDQGVVSKDPNRLLSKRSIYYDYDKFDIRAEYRPIVEAHAKYLRENPGAKVLIQGTADERGSREYNVGLGQRRSDSVKRTLLLLGAKENQIESVSLGEEKPACTEHAEGCWWKNRRGDLRYGGEY